MNTSSTATSKRWILLAFLTSLNVINFIDRQLISSLAVPIKAEIHLSDFHIGLLSGYAFATFYSVMGLYLGMMADRVNRIRMIAGGLFLWSAMTALSGLARDFGELTLARVLVGIGEATLTPAALSMLAEVFPVKQRSLAAGIYYMGIPFGISLSLVIAGRLEPLIGWRYCFQSIGVLGVLMTSLIFLFRDPRLHLEQSSGSPSVRPPFQFSEVFRALWEIPGVLASCAPLVLVMIGGCMLNISVGATYHDMIWMVEDRHFTKMDAANRMSIIFLLGGVFGNVFGGWLGGWIEQRLKLHRLSAVILALLICVPMLVVFRLVPGSSLWFWVGYFFVSISVTIYYGPVFSTVLELSPAHLKSTMMAFFLIGMNLLGASLGAVIAPLIMGATGSRTTGLLVTGLFSLFSIPLFLMSMKLMAHTRRTDGRFST